MNNQWILIKKKYTFSEQIYISVCVERGVCSTVYHSTGNVSRGTSRHLNVFFFGNS